MQPNSDELYDDLQKQFQRDINCLTDEDRNIRFKGLNNINQQLFTSTRDRAAIARLFEKNLLRNVIRLMDDKVEKHKTISLEILNKFLDNINDADIEMISAILKCFISRLNAIPYPEQSEELRLNIILSLRKILKLGYKLAIQKNLPDLTFMISKTLADAFPDVKKESSNFVMDLSREMKDRLGDHASAIAKALVINFGHNHAKVRKITIETSGELLLTQSGASQMKELLPALKKVVNDGSLEVRKATYEVIARLLNGFSNADLREYESDLVQLLLNGLSDSSEELVQICVNLITQVGKNVKKLEMEIEENQPKIQ